MPFARRATRIEIYKRLCRARDYIESCYDEPVSLPLLAGVACLSRHHFLRLFREIFRMTPHQYLTEVRLQKARRLVEENDRPVAEVCVAVGFEDPSSFARLFRRRFGRTPRALRRPARWR
ncbi:MAG: helix-turn-helix domain-containing protein [Pyrinomonadaceae bacterium]